MSAPASLHRFVLIHRRLLAAGFAALAVLFALAALKPSVDGSPVVVVRHDLAAGSVLTAADLRRATLPAAARPAHAWTSVGALLGRRIAAPMRRGEPITDFRLLGPSLLGGYGAELVLSTIPVSDSSQLAGLRVGDHVNIVGSDPQEETGATVIARRAVVVSLPRGGNRDEAAALAVAVDEASGLRLATARLRAQLSILAVR